jgi:Protein of unknown function (DUF3592)
MTTVTPATDANIARANFWKRAVWILPPLTLAAVWAIASFFGVFDGVPLVGQDLTPLQAFLLSCGMFHPVAAYFYTSAQWNIARAQGSRTWPAVRGFVKSSQVVERYNSRWGTTYKLDIDYRYKVGEREFSGDRVEFGNPRVSDQDFINRLAGKYRTNAEVMVHYDPADPTIAVLETSEESALAYASGNRWRAYFFLFLPVLFWLVMVLHPLLISIGWFD